MLHLFKNKLFLLLIATIIIFTVIGISAQQNSSINKFSSVFSVVMSPLQQFFSFSGQKIEGSLTFFNDIKALKKENDDLKATVDQMQKDNRELAVYKEENQKLKETLNLKDEFNDYDFVGANVIAKDPGNWFNVFRIDRGGSDGIGNDFPVITSSGLVGRVINPDPTSSKVVSIIDVDSVVSGIISKNRYVVVVKGDITLKDQGLCRMDYIPAEADVEVGDTVETSGLGGIFPKGIIIGRVKAVSQSTSELDRYAVIDPAVDFKRLEEVFILKNKTNNTGIGSAQK